MIIKDPAVRTAVNRLERIAHEQCGDEIAQVARNTNIRRALTEREERTRRWWDAAIRYARRTPHNLLGFTQTETANDLVMAKNIGTILEAHYQGWEWLIGVQDGVATIRSTKLDGAQGYLLHTDKLHPYSEMERQVKKAGGEILERYGMPRRSFDPQTYLAVRRFKLMRRGGWRLHFDT